MRVIFVARRFRRRGKGWDASILRDVLLQVGIERVKMPPGRIACPNAIYLKNARNEAYLALFAKPMSRPSIR
jgi:hypothetical protein